MKKFKDIYNEELGKTEEFSTEVTIEEASSESTTVASDKIRPLPSKDTLSRKHTGTVDKESFVKQYAIDEQKAKIREEMTTFLTEEVKEELKEQLRESVKKELHDELFMEVYDTVQKEILDSVLSQTKTVNEGILGAINDLGSKINKLTENLNIEIPTPVVHVTTPRTKKKVIRDENGFVESIVEIEEDD
jgi:hypothetical protein